MRKVVLYSAMSIDCMIADAKGGVGWLESPRYRIKGEDFGYARLLRSVDASIMGHRTYRQALSFGGVPAGDAVTYVMTRSPNRRPRPGVVFLTRNIVRQVRALRARKGKDIWLVGGSETNTLLMNAGLVDLMVLTIIPVVLGAGVPLFGPDVRTRNFRLRTRKVYENGFVQGTWERI